MAYIAYSTPKANGAVYATVVESTREGSKVKQQRIENLGRVIDVQKGIFKNRKRGVFRYTLEDGFMDADIPAPDSAGMQPAPEKLILDFDETDARIAKLGTFMLLSSDDMETKDILPLYYTRQQVEQVFDIGKNNADLLPLRIQHEDTFRGHLMLTFMATAIFQKLQRDILSRRKKGDRINPEGAFMKLRNQKCKVYEQNIIPQEPVKEVNDIYKLLGIKFPTLLPRDELM